MKTKKIQIDPLARVEGEGVLYVQIRDGKLEDIKFKIIEPPRFFEALLRGRMYTEAPDITARICGICPVAYQMSTVHALEHACGAVVDGQLRALRRLLYCGEWIESHVLHIFMLHAPDFLGYPDVMHLARDYPEHVKRALQLKKAGNAIMSFIGGREIHPINVRVGGFYRVPTKQEFKPLVENLKWARDAALETVRWTAQLPFPDWESEYEFVSLRHPDEYPFNEGHLVSNNGLDIPASEYEDHFVEEHVSYSSALHSIHKGYGAYLTGPMSRYNLNYAKLSSLAHEAARSVELGPTSLNPFKSIIIRSIEVLYAFDEALRIIEQYEVPDQPAVKVQLRAGIGHACTEAPRGTLYIRLEIDDEGRILNAKIVPPTSQNQKAIENDLRYYANHCFDLPEEQFLQQCEQAIRNHDPCISCATHFLKLHIDRT